MGLPHRITSYNVCYTKLLRGDSIDLAIRLGAPAPMEGIVCRTLGRHQRWVVASPGYLAKQGEPKQPADLSQHNCLRFNS